MGRFEIVQRTFDVQKAQPKNEPNAQGGKSDFRSAEGALAIIFKFVTACKDRMKVKT